MNNVVFGNERFTYYETIGGGQGACPDADGPSGVHVAMSNTLTTPTEALELAYPLRVGATSYESARAAPAVHHGGDGVVRELRVLEPAGCRSSRSGGAGAPRRGRRRGRAAGAQPRERRGAAGVRVARARTRRRRQDRDAGRRRLRGANR